MRKNIKVSKPNKENVIIQQVIVRPLQRNAPDLDNWKTAMQNAENGRRYQLLNLLTNLMDDPRLSSVVEKRILAITNSQWVFNDANGQEVEAITKLIESTAFETILEEVQNVVLYGHTLLELSKEGDTLNAELIPRNHVKPETGVVVINETDVDGIPFREIPYSYYCLEAGKKKDFGLLFKAAPFVIFKKGNYSDWAQYAELFGMPMRIGKYDINDPDGKLAMEQQAESAGSASFLVIPNTTDLEIKDGKGTGDGSLYDKLKDACNEEITILLLGQTMTTENGSSKSQGEVHLKVEESLHKKDRRRVARVLNEKLKPILLNLGYPVDGGKFSVKDESKLSTKERLEILNMVKANTPVSDDEYYDASGVPKPDNYEELKKQKEAVPPPAPPEPPTGPKSAKGKEKKLFAKFLDLFTEAE